MDHASPHLAELVRINDTLTWSQDNRDSFVSAVEIIRLVVGAHLSPVFLLSESGTRLVQVSDDRQRAVLGEGFASMPAGPYLRPPWINPGEWPVSARDHLDTEAWAVLPAEFKAWFGTSGIVVPIHADGRHLGAILLAFDGAFTLADPTREFLAVAGRILGSALYRWQVAAHERELGALEERRRLGEELHVDLSQQIATLGLRIETTQLDLRSGDLELARTDVRDLAELLESLKRSLRHLMLGLRADAETTEGSFLGGIEAHLDHFRSQFDVPLDFACPSAEEADRIPLEVGAQLLRVLQEGLANAYRHSHATRVTVRLVVTHTKVRMEIDDDGEGIAPGAIPDSRMGLRIMAQRMEQVAGSLDIHPSAAGGTLVVAEAPLRGLSRSVLRVEGHA